MKQELRCLTCGTVVAEVQVTLNYVNDFTSVPALQPKVGQKAMQDLSLVHNALSGLLQCPWCSKVDNRRLV